jgi:hypothetical protein
MRRGEILFAAGDRLCREQGTALSSFRSGGAKPGFPVLDCTDADDDVIDQASI